MRFDAWLGAVGWDQSRFFEHAQLVLQPGDAVFFLGNAVHAGAAFAEGNVRLHVYVETEELHQRRLPDTTFFMDTFAGVANILPRGVKLP
jgi:ectoine hydroxylase-related dioxygenase (phytanoyl-CoA dioxygenase family)